MKTIECTDCGWVTDIETTDTTAPRHCPECMGALVVAGTAEPWPTKDSAIAD